MRRAGQLSRLQGQTFSGIRRTGCEFQLGVTGLAAVDTELAVGTANGIVINNSTGEHYRARAELGSGTHDCSGMQHHHEVSGHLLKHLLPGFTEGRITNGHDHLIGCRLNGGLKQPMQVPRERQGTQDRCSVHQRACRQGVVKKAHDMIATGSNGIANGAAMAAGSKD